MSRERRLYFLPCVYVYDKRNWLVRRLRATKILTFSDGPSAIWPKQCRARGKLAEGYNTKNELQEKTQSTYLLWNISSFSSFFLQKFVFYVTEERGHLGLDLCKDSYVSYAIAAQFAWSMIRMVPKVWKEKTWNWSRKNWGLKLFGWCKHSIILFVSSWPGYCSAGSRFDFDDLREG